MRRIIVVGCVTVLLGMGVLLDLAANADEREPKMSETELSAEKSICMEVASEFPVSQDTCVVCVHAGESGAQCLCESIPEKDMRKDGRLENHSQCVKMFRHFLERKLPTD